MERTKKKERLHGSVWREGMNEKLNKRKIEIRNGWRMAGRRRETEKKDYMKRKSKIEEAT